MQIGGIKSTSRFARFYLVPGFYHSLSGARPTPVGQFEALVCWVEEGRAPFRIIEELKDEEGNIIRT